MSLRAPLSRPCSRQNLAKFAARDSARRKAARLSKIGSSPSNSRPNSIISSGSSHRSQPMSPMSPLSPISESKRGSLLGRSLSLNRKGKEREVEVSRPST
jgi:hypothetical protein